MLHLKKANICKCSETLNKSLAKREGEIIQVRDDLQFSSKWREVLLCAEWKMLESI